jgi:signal peptidase I
VNGVLAAEDIYYPTYQDPTSTVKYPYTVEEGKAFILNDFREKTDDSRRFGTINLDDIDGPLILSLRRRGF